MKARELAELIHDAYREANPKTEVESFDKLLPSSRRMYVSVAHRLLKKLVVTPKSRRVVVR